MTQKERLIELLCEVTCEGSDRREGGCGLRQDGKCNHIDKLDMCMMACIAERLLENGVIVPPCKVGDKVYAYMGAGMFTSAIVVRIESTETPSGREKSYIAMGAESPGVKFNDECIGKTVFFTREEAKKALAEREGIK